MTTASGDVPAPTGDLLIGGTPRPGRGTTFVAYDPTTGDALEPASTAASAADVADAVEAAVAAAAELATWSDSRRADLLDAIAAGLEGLGPTIIAVADRETGLGTARLTGELGRTCGQLRSFAGLVRTGGHLDVIIDRADADAAPPRPDLRRIQVALGPVAVFGASNFPLAFGVVGGDTASALAAGCPVVAKGHPSHPATSELCGRAVSAAIAAAGAPGGTFSLLQGPSPDLGAALVGAPGVRAVGFTGSLSGGRALFDLAAARPDPIPVYAEMGSTNPVFVTSAVIGSRLEQLAAGLAASVTMGTGQFCTKPGLVFVASDPTLVADAVTAQLPPGDGGVMLNASLAEAYRAGIERAASRPGVIVAHGGGSDASPGGSCRVEPMVLVCDRATYTATPELAEEHFGPATIVVGCGSDAELVELARTLGGNLTASIHSTPDDAPLAAQLAGVLTDKVGRLVFDGFPTGVAVTAAMQHGGPYPATTAPGTTSVGTTAIRRFLRPVTYQDAPDAVLPPALQRANPLGLTRLLDGELTRAAG